MIENGINPVSGLGTEPDGSYTVVLGRLRLPTLPLTREQLTKLNKRELVGELGAPKVDAGLYYSKRYFERLNEVNLARAVFKITAVRAEFKDGAQVITGKIRSVGTRDNSLLWFLREYRPETLCFGMRAFVRDHEDIVGGKRIEKVITWDLVAPPAPTA